MVGVLLDVIDRLIKLADLRSARLKQMYEECFKPAFADLHRVHSDYLSMVREARALIRPPVRMLPFVRGSDEYNKERLHELADFLEARRLKLEPVRTRLRAMDALLNHKQSLPPDAERFVQSITDYLLGGPRGGLGDLSEASIEIVVQNTLSRRMVIEVGLALRKVQCGAAEPAEARHHIDLLLTRIDSERRDRWAWVCHCYTLLQRAVADGA